MALFRTHVTFGALIAVVGTVFAYYYALVTDWRLLVALFLVTVFASFLPDLDSDSGLPFQILFGTFTLVCTGIALFVTLVLDPTDPYLKYGIPLGTLVFVWFVLGGIFKQFTHHRGMVHSVPALAVAGLLTYLAVKSLLADDYAALILALGMAAGYASHLVLDELDATMNIDGSVFEAKRSLGTALKLLSGSRVANVFTYGLLCLLIYQVL